MFQSDRQGREVDKEDRSRRGDCSQLQRTGHSHEAGEVRCGIGVGILLVLVLVYWYFLVLEVLYTGHSHEAREVGSLFHRD